MIRTELNLRLPNSPGALADVCRLLGDERVNTIALSLDAGGHLRLVVDNPVRAAGVLRGRHHQVTERDVIFLTVGNLPGGLAPMLTMVAEASVNVDYMYSGFESNLGMAVVLGVDNALKASALSGL